MAGVMVPQWPDPTGKSPMDPGMAPVPADGSTPMAFPTQETHMVVLDK